MTKIKKTMCEISANEIKKKEKELLKEISNPEYYCKKCVHVASTKDLLCKPQKIKRN